MTDPVVQGLEVYIVGGAVRDALLGCPAGDRDWVVVGAGPADMTARGFVPVGDDFPVFLHPVSHEEYALARSERKCGRGYRGFVFHAGKDVSLEADLARRDLTINAIAQAPDGRLIDPLGGRRDLEQGVLRHVGPAFSEDPVRLLRLARFAARFHDFSIAPETMALARDLVASGEVDALVAERVWQEFTKGLMTGHPARMIDVLLETQALERVVPGLVLGARWREELACAARANLEMAGRFALLCRHSAQPQALALHLRAPVVCRDQARLLPQLLAGLAGMTGAGDVLAIVMACDALRKPERFFFLLSAASCVQTVHLPFWQACVAQLRAIDAGAIARNYPGVPAQIRQALDAARLGVVEQLMASEAMAPVAANKAQ